MKRMFQVTLLTISLLAGACSTKSEDPQPLPTDDLSVKMEDPLFRQFCLTNFDTDADGKLSRAEADAVERIILSDPEMTSLQGIPVVHIVLDRFGHDGGRYGLAAAALYLGPGTVAVEFDAVAVHEDYLVAFIKQVGLLGDHGRLEVVEIGLDELLGLFGQLFHRNGTLIVVGGCCRVEGQEAEQQKCDLFHDGLHI